MSLLNLTEEDELILSKAWASVAAEKDWSPEARAKELEQLDYFLKVSGNLPNPRKIVYIFEVEYGDVQVFSSRDKAIDRALEYLRGIFKDKKEPQFWSQYRNDIEKWLYIDGETGAMGREEYSSCYIYKREIND